MGKGPGRPAARWGAVAVLAFALLAACSNPQEKKEHAIERGKAYFAEGERVKASLEFRTALQIDPLAVEPLYYMGLIEEEDGDLVGALAQYTKVLDQVPDHQGALLHAGQISLAANDLSRTQTYAATILQKTPDNAPALALRAAVALRKNALDDAARDAERARAIDPANAAATAVMAGIAARRGAIDEALQVLDQGIERNPGDDGLRLVKLELLASRNDRAGIEATLRELVAIKPENASYRWRLANFLADSGKLADGETLLREAITQAPKDLGLRQMLVRYLAERVGAEAAENELKAMIAGDGDVIAYRLALADLYYQIGRDEEGTKILKAVVEKSGTERDGLTARVALASHAFAKGQYAEARSLIDEVLSVEETRADALLIRARLNLEGSNPYAAIADLRAVLRQDPKSRAALLLLARASLDDWRTDQARRAYETYLKIDPGNDEIEVELAQEMVSAGDARGARKQLESVLERSPDFVPAVTVNVDLLLAEAKYDEAEAAAQRLIDADERADPRIIAAGHALLGKVYLARHTPLQAIPELDLALHGLPDAADLQGALVEAYLQSGQSDTALAFVNAEIARVPARAAPRLLRADIERRLGKEADAATTLKGAIEAQPEWAASYVRLGGLLETKGDISGALSTYQAGLSRNPAHIDLLHHVAALQEKTEDYEGAKTTYETTLNLNPSDVFAANNLAALIADLWSKDAALLRRAEQLSQDFRLSTNPYLLDTGGWVAYRLGRYDDALVLLESARQKQPDNAQFHYHLALTYQAKGDDARAQAELRKATATSEDYRGLDEARRLLVGN